MIPFDRLVVGPARDGALALERPFASLEGIPAKLYIARRTPTEQRPKASKTRGLKRPDLEVGFFFIEIRGFDYCYRMGFPLGERIAIVIENQAQNGRMRRPESGAVGDDRAFFAPFTFIARPVVPRALLFRGAHAPRELLLSECIAARVFV